jgi:hypothetical protein
MFVHPIHGRKESNVIIGLSEGSDGERTSCYLFDYDPTHCLLAGGDSLFVKADVYNNHLVWRKYYNSSKDESLNPFASNNEFEFELIKADMIVRLLFNMIWNRHH